jgi:hypothetical protein
MSNYIRFLPNPITDYLQDNWQLILNELIQQRLEKTNINLLEVQNSSNKLNFKETVHLKQPLFQGNIISVALYVNKNILTISEKRQMNWAEDEEERWWDDNINGMPTIAKWIKENKSYIDGVVFYAAQPGSFINHHYGVDGTRNNLRMHLCLLGDPDCQFNIENEIHAWTPGDLFAFDDTMFFHGIKHRGHTPRIILSIDIKKEAVRDFAINFIERPFVSSKEKTPPTISEW